MNADPVDAITMAKVSPEEKISRLRSLGLQVMDQSRHQHKVWAGQEVAEDLHVGKCEICGASVISNGIPALMRCNCCLYATAIQITREIDKGCGVAAR